MTRFPTVLFSRSPIIFWYSGDLYHPSAASRDGNSIITRRGCGHSPSNNFKSPPRTMNLPPKASIVAGTAFRYSANMASSLAVSVAITNAFIIFSLIGQLQMRQIQGKYPSPLWVKSGHMRCSKFGLLLDHLIGTGDQRRRNSEAESCRCLETDDKFDLRRL